MEPPKRKAIPLRVKLNACLDMLELLDKEIQWDHDPALGIRPYDEHDYSPPQLDPRFIRPMLRGLHDIKTNGTAVPLSGDKTLAAKTKRISSNEEEFRKRLLTPRQDREKPKSNWPSRKFQNRKKERDR